LDWTAFGLSLKLAAWTCVLLIPLSLVLARLLAWSRFAAKPLVEAMIMLPLVLPPTVLGYYLLVGLAPNSAIGGALRWLGGGPMVFTFNGILLASLIVNLPFAVQPMQRAFETVDPNVREAAWTSGLSYWHTFLKIELPLAWPGIVSAIALVFAHTLGEFGVILMVGGSIPGETRTAAIAIYDNMQAFRGDAAAAMAAALLLFSFLTLAVVHLAAARQSAVRKGER